MTVHTDTKQILFASFVIKCEGEDSQMKVSSVIRKSQRDFSMRKIIPLCVAALSQHQPNFLCCSSSVVKVSCSRCETTRQNQFTYFPLNQHEAPWTNGTHLQQIWTWLPGAITDKFLAPHRNQFYPVCHVNSQTLRCNL